MPSSPLIQVEELGGLLAGPEPERPAVLDVRYRLGVSTGRQDFELAHIPGASYVDMETELATIRPDRVGGRHPMPTVATFTTAMRSAGVTMSRHVVAYDDWDSLTASRVWWMLRHLGFLGVRVLDGGIAAWTAAGLPTESGPRNQSTGDFSPSSQGFGRLLDATDAMTYATRHLLLDARPAARFRGENETIDAVAGHIPGAVSAPALDNVDPFGRFLPADQLAGRLRELGVADATATAVARGTTRATGTSDATATSDARTVGTYCGSGVQATHLALALSVAGITDDADVYIGSWSDWITDPDRPIALG
jgi:thiosulfate/3-mercaptopyruvate sulfurtransferase